MGLFYTTKNQGSLRFRKVKPRFGGVAGVKHPPHPQIWEPPRKVSKSQNQERPILSEFSYYAIKALISMVLSSVSAEKQIAKKRRNSSTIINQVN